LLQTFDKQKTNVTTSEDPFLQEYSTKVSETTVFATDLILSTLMTATRSLYSWDILITKEGSNLFLDKRDHSAIGE
jgi:translation initiation factor 3 subunit D